MAIKENAFFISGRKKVLKRVYEVLNASDLIYTYPESVNVGFEDREEDWYLRLKLVEGENGTLISVDKDGNPLALEENPSIPVTGRPGLAEVGRLKESQVSEEVEEPRKTIEEIHASE